MDYFDIRARDEGRIHVVEVKGEFDLSACARFRQQAETTDAQMIVVDLRSASFIDSHALSELIRLQNRALTGDFRLAIIRPEGLADRIFSITGTDGHLPLYDERVPVLAHMNFG